MKYDIIFFPTEPESRIESKVICNLNNSIGTHFPKLKTSIAHHNSFRGLFKIINTKNVVVHSPLIRSFLVILLSRLLQKRLLVLIWDIYPIKINARRYDKRMKRRFYDILENLSLRFCHHHIIPTEDFKRVKQVRNTTTISFWPKLLSRFDSKDILLADNQDGELKILFAGQINATRGLEEALKRLDDITPTGFKLLIASSSPVPRKLKTDPRVHCLGFLKPYELKKLLVGCDFGLISLAKGFDGPAFPSKSFEYLAAGLPCIYHGPRLEDFIYIIEHSGVGIDMKKVEKLTVDQSENMRNNFSDKLRCFERLACLQTHDVQMLVKLMR